MFKVIHPTYSCFVESMRKLYRNDIHLLADNSHEAVNVNENRCLIFMLQMYAAAVFTII